MPAFSMPAHVLGARLGHEESLLDAAMWTVSERSKDDPRSEKKKEVFEVVEHETSINIRRRHYAHHQDLDLHRLRSSSSNDTITPLASPEFRDVILQLNHQIVLSHFSHSLDGPRRQIASQSEDGFVALLAFARRSAAEAADILLLNEQAVRLYCLISNKNLASVAGEEVWID